MSSDPPVSRRNLVIGRTLAILMVVMALAIVAVLGLRLKVWRDASTTVAPDSAVAQQCPDAGAEALAAAERVVLTMSDGTRLGGAATGPAEAPEAVILRHGASQTICDWLQWAAQISERTGDRVVLFDRRGRGSSPGQPNLSREPEDLREVVRQVSDSGPQRIALVGSSMGNSVLFAALPGLTPAPCAVVAISPVLISGDSAGEVRGDALTSLTSNTWIVWETKNESVARAAGQIEQALSTQGLAAPHRLALETTDHSWTLVTKHPQVADFVREGIASCR